MTLNEAKQKLAEFEKTQFALSHSMGLMYYDGATIAPKGSADVRALTLGEMSRISYNLTTSPKTVEMLEALVSHKDELDAIASRKVSELYLNYDRMRRIPVQEYVAYQALLTKGDAVWHEAKEKSDFALFEPYLQKIFDSSKQIALYIEPDKKPYDTMLDLFERGLDTKRCDEFFVPLRKKLVPLINKVKENAGKVDDTPLNQTFPVKIQRKFSDFLMDILDLDRNHCIIGETEHPFTTSFSKNDVRITTHYYENMLVSSLYSVVHEGGHALYEQHIGDDIALSQLGNGVSMAIHESQSRFYENVIGRSREFGAVIFPWLKKEFSPRLDSVTEEEFYKIVNKSAPSLIRTEADELTYSLHIMVRYELERRMFEGELTAKDLPGEWNRLYREYLGIDVPNDKTGVLQDSHWSNGNIGYFPSYAIGSAYAAQFLEVMKKDIDVAKEVKSGKLTNINKWFEERIWKYGRLYDPGVLFEMVCGRFDPDAYISYLEKKYSEVYEL